MVFFKKQTPRVDTNLIKRNYAALKKILVQDGPYDLQIEDRSFFPIFEQVHTDIIEQHSCIDNLYYSKNGVGFINLLYLDHFLILCFRLAHFLFKNSGDQNLMDTLYYISRIRTATDIFFRAEIGDCFMPVHPIGSVIDSRSTYGFGFRLYNGVHVGPYNIAGKSPDEWTHPTFGDGVILYGNSAVFGNTKIGNNVIVSPKTTIINEQIPDNCVVMGTSPRLIVMPNLHSNLAVFKRS